MKYSHSRLLKKNYLQTSEPRAWERWTVIGIQLLIAMGAIGAFWVASDQASKFRKSLEIQQAITRPFIFIETADQPDEYKDPKILFRFINRGVLPGRLLYFTFQAWVDVLEDFGKESKVETILYPDEITKFKVLSFSEEAFSPIKEGGRKLRIGACAIYESASAGDDRRWLAQSWFEFSSKDEKVVIKIREEEAVSMMVKKVNLKDYLPEDWVDLRALYVEKI